MKRLTTITLCIFLSQISTGQVMMLFSSDSLTNITSPLDVDSLFYWFAADVGVTDSLGGAIATDEGVGQWNDLSGNGYHVTQGTNTARPVYKATGGPGSKPTIQFDGTNDYLISGSHWWGSDDATLFIVGKFANATRDAVESFVMKGATASNTAQFTYRGGTAAQSYVIRWFSYKGAASDRTEYNDDAKSSAFRLSVFFSNGAGSHGHWHDGVSATSTRVVVGTGDDTIYDGSSAFVVGANTDLATQFLQGSISEIIVFSRALTTTERAAIELYLNRKYDLYYLIIIGFPLAPTVGAKRRKLIPNDKKKAA